MWSDEDDLPPDLRKRRERRDDFVEMYRQQLVDFHKAMDISYNISRFYANRQMGSRRAWATSMYTRLCVMGTTLTQILPESRLNGWNIVFWDLSSIASISRSVLETCLWFHYVAGTDMADESDEWSLRLNLIHLHDATARISMLTRLVNGEAEAVEVAKQREELVERLNTNPLIAGFSEKQRAHLLRGERMIFGIQDDILTSMGEDKEKFRGWYDYCSAHSHGYALAFHRILLDGRFDGTDSPLVRAWTTMLLQYVEKFLIRAAGTMVALFPTLPDPRLGALAAAAERAVPRVLLNRSVDRRSKVKGDLLATGSTRASPFDPSNR